MDSAATTLMPEPVLQCWLNVQSTVGASPGRGQHTLARRADEILARSRERVLRYLGLGTSHTLVFTRNATEALNLAAFGVEQLVALGDVIVATSLDHHSTLLPVKRLTARRSAALLEIPLLPCGDLDLAVIEGLKGRPIRLAAVPAVSNVNGNRPDVERLAALVAKRDGLVLVDATQSVGHGPADPALRAADLIAFSAHKMYGPKGIGALAVKRDLLHRLDPMLVGGGMVRSILSDGEPWIDGPARFEAGTQDPALAACFAAACDFIESLGVEEIEKHERTLHGQAREVLGSVPGISLIPQGRHHSPAILSFKGPIHGHDLSEALSAKGICIRTGHMCAQTAVAAFETTSINRISFGVYSTLRDIEALADVLNELDANP